MKLKDLQDGDIAGFFGLRKTKLNFGIVDEEILGSLIKDLVELQNYMLDNQNAFDGEHIDNIDDALRCLAILCRELKFDQ